MLTVGEGNPIGYVYFSVSFPCFLSVAVSCCHFPIILKDSTKFQRRNFPLFCSILFRQDRLLQPLQPFSLPSFTGLVPSEGSVRIWKLCLQRKKAETSSDRYFMYLDIVLQSLDLCVCAANADQRYPSRRIVIL